MSGASEFQQQARRLAGGRPHGVKGVLADRGWSGRRIDSRAVTLDFHRTMVSGLQFAMVGTALALRMASAATSDLSYAMLAGYALAGRAQAIQALGLSWLFGMLSSGIAPVAMGALVARFVVLAAAAVSVLGRSGALRPGGLPMATKRGNGLVFPTLLLGALFIGHSLLFSPMKDVSVLKALSWTVVAATLLMAWSGLSVIERSAVERQVFGGLIALLLCSLPLLVLPLGYLANGNGFQGVLSQPQAFGLTIALLGAWAGSRMLSDARPTLRGIALFAVCSALVMLSESRTSGLALLSGIALAGIVGSALARRPVRDFLPGLRSRLVHVVVGLSLMVPLLAGSALFDRLDEFMSKRSDRSGLAETYNNSRGNLLDQMWTNIQAEPWRGIGFGLGSHLDVMIIDRDSTLGLPTGASIEKGVMPMAVLEELGVFGFVAVMLWLWMLVRRAARDGGMAALAVVLTALLLNLGESTLFSPGGMGLLSLILIGWAVSSGRHEAPDPSVYA